MNWNKQQSEAQVKFAHFCLGLLAAGVLFCIFSAIHFAVEYLVKRGCM